MIDEFDEPSIRALRDKVYGRKSTHENWSACKHKWMTEPELRWLLDQARAIDQPRPA